jgi:1-phosphatidylinositol-3-phosphate 5-kinase
MIACFRYASINLHSVYLPPSILEFNYDSQDWLQKEADEVDKLILVEILDIALTSESFCIHEIIDLVQQVRNKAEILFSEVCSSLNQISKSFLGPVLQEGGNAVTDFKHLIAELKGMLHKEKEESEVRDLRCCDSLPFLQLFSRCLPLPKKRVSR